MNDATPRPLLQIRPHFDEGLNMVYAGMATAAAVPVVTIGGGGLLLVLFALTGLNRLIPPGYVFGLLLIATVVVCPPLFFEIRKKSLMRTVFDFYGDYVEYQYYHFHLSLRRGRVRYRDVSDIWQKASTLQEQRRLTTISLFVPSMRFQTKGFAGLEIVDLPQSRDYLRHVMSIVENSANPPAETQVTITAPMSPFGG